MHLNCKNAISTLQMNNKIKHSGIVESVEEGCVCIRIVQSSACSACKVAAHCTASESKEKMIEVSTSEASLYHKGDSVVVTADLLPLILMVIALVGVLKATRSEGAAALSALGILIPYYVVLYLFRNKLKNKLSFSIES